MNLDQRRTHRNALRVAFHDTVANTRVATPAAILEDTCWGSVLAFRQVYFLPALDLRLVNLLLRCDGDACQIFLWRFTVAPRWIGSVNGQHKSVKGQTSAMYGGFVCFLIVSTHAFHFSCFDLFCPDLSPTWTERVQLVRSKRYFSADLRPSDFADSYFNLSSGSKAWTVRK